MVSASKMTIPDARRELVQAGKGVFRRLQDLDRMQRALDEAALEARVAEVQRRIAESNLTFRRIAAVDSWLVGASRPYQRRKKFLVLEGPSGLGKTEFAKNLVGVDQTLELNCASCGLHPDLRGFQYRRHKAVFFDEASPALVIANKKLFQAPAALIDLGHSPTGQSVYRVFLADAVLIVGSNTWATDVAARPKSEDRDWLAANSVVIRVTEPLWMEPPCMPEPRQSPGADSP